MNEGLKNILSRNSPRELSEPIPSSEEMELVYKAALRGQIMLGKDLQDL